MLDGITRIQLTVSSFEACATFYGVLMASLEMRVLYESPDLKSWANRRLAVVIVRGGRNYRDERFVQERVGLHHLSFRVRRRADANRAHEMVRRLGAKIVDEPGAWPWAPGYYSFAFEDPDGIRLEISHVPDLDEPLTLPVPRPTVPT